MALDRLPHRVVTFDEFLDRELLGLASRYTSGMKRRTSLVNGVPVEERTRRSEPPNAPPTEPAGVFLNRYVVKERRFIAGVVIVGLGALYEECKLMLEHLVQSGRIRPRPDGSFAGPMLFHGSPSSFGM
jgi:hypothetical protein